MKVFVNDTNILIDLADLNLLGYFTQLGIELRTLDIIVDEIKDKTQRNKVAEVISNNSIKVHTLDSDELINVFTLKSSYSGLSFEDCSVWYYTKKISGVLLTGDGRLRKIASSDGLEVRGILFVLDKLIENNIITKQLALIKIKALAELNPRLPKNEIDNRINYWSE